MGVAGIWFWDVYIHILVNRKEELLAARGFFLA
jgi:hypothetical protein